MLICVAFLCTSIDRGLTVCVCFAFACVHVFVHVCCMCTVGCADLMTLDTMTPQERKRQGYIHELIQTEETYVEDLELVLDVNTLTTSII